MIRCVGGVGEVGAHLGDGVEGKGEGIEDNGDEGGGAAEGLGDGLAVAVEDVMTVVADDEAAPGNDGLGVCDHEGRSWEGKYELFLIFFYGLGEELM